MKTYTPPNPSLWSGRISGEGLYLHERIQYLELDKDATGDRPSSVALLGYACDEGVRRNQGRPGAFAGPDAIRRQLGRLPLHFDQGFGVFDAGNIHCTNGDMEAAQRELSRAVVLLLQQQRFPLLLGGGHDIAYGHYKGIEQHLDDSTVIGIINFDAHFDLRSNKGSNHSGTPFYQIASDCRARDHRFRYFCLGVRKDANDRNLFLTAEDLAVDFMRIKQFALHRFVQIEREINQFISEVDALYVTIDLDGFSSAYAPGVSASSPMGFAPDIVLETLRVILESKKTVGIDIAEMNPEFDIDYQTAKLAASLLHFIMHKVALL